MSVREAAKHGNLYDVKRAIDNGGAISECDEFGSTPLHVALERGKLSNDIVYLLIQCEADVNAKNKFGVTPLHYALNREQFSKDVVDLLIQHGADVNAKDEYVNTPLHYAVNHEQPSKDVVDLLIQHGADVNARDRFGYTALHDAVYHEQPSKDVVDLLIQRGTKLSISERESLKIILAERIRRKEFGDAHLIRKALGLSQTISGDDEVTQAYQRALKNGKKKNNRIPVMIVGQDRTGKTSLRKRLLGLPFDAEEPSTVGINVDFVELSKSSSKKPWKPKEFKSFLTSKHVLEGAICREAGTILRESQNRELRLSEEESDQSEEASFFSNMDWDKEIQDGPVNDSPIPNPNNAGDPSQDMKHENCAVSAARESDRNDRLSVHGRESAANIIPSEYNEGMFEFDIGSPNLEYPVSRSERSEELLTYRQISPKPGLEAAIVDSKASEQTPQNQRICADLKDQISISEKDEEPSAHKKSSFDQGAPATVMERESDEETSHTETSHSTTRDKLLNERPSLSQTTKILNHRDAETIQQHPPIRMIVHDLAGQSIFYDTHYLFLKPHCPYILVHDLTKPLDEIAKPRFKPVNAEIDLGNPLLATNLDYLLLWLNVLAQLWRHESDAQRNCEDFALPPVMIALTNIDQFKGNVEEVKKRIRDVISEGEFPNVLVDTIHIIDNTTASPKKDSIIQLRDCTFDLCEKILPKEQPMPLTWMKYEEALTREAFGKRNKRNYIRVEEAKEIAEKCGVDSFEEALIYFQRQGIFVYYKKCPFVVLNPVWLMNLFTEVITIPDVQDQRRPLDAPYHKKLRKHGILMMEFLEGHDHGVLLQDVMQRVSLMCPLQHDGKEAFLVPSVAPLMKKGESIMAKLKASPLTPLFIVFVCKFLLPGIFARLQVKLVNECRRLLRQGSEEPRLYSNYSSFPLVYGSVKFNVYLVQLIEKIKIGVVPTGDVPSNNCLGEFASFLKKCLGKCLEAIKSEEPLFYRGVQYHFDVQCTACVGENEEHCHRHKKDKCEHDECVHLRPLSDLDCGEDCVSCSVSGDIFEFDLKRVKP